jgi:hypothetical protein
VSGRMARNVDLDLIRLMSEIKTALLTARPPIRLKRHLFVSELRLNRYPFPTDLHNKSTSVHCRHSPIFFFSDSECEPNVEFSLSVRNQSSLSLGCHRRSAAPTSVRHPNNAATTQHPRALTPGTVATIFRLSNTVLKIQLIYTSTRTTAVHSGAMEAPLSAGRRRRTATSI